jgi:hypothetical protein
MNLNEGLFTILRFSKVLKISTTPAHTTLQSLTQSNVLDCQAFLLARLIDFSAYSLQVQRL